jgi:hypothetical protein
MYHLSVHDLLQPTYCAITFPEGFNFCEKSTCYNESENTGLSKVNKTMNSRESAFDLHMEQIH